MTALGDHYRPSDDTHAPGTYRVVGTADGFTLLRITDEDGTRESTGEIVHVDDLAGFSSTSDPDAGIHPLHEIRNLLQGLYWSVRRFL